METQITINFELSAAAEKRALSEPQIHGFERFGWEFELVLESLLGHKLGGRTNGTILDVAGHRISVAWTCLPRLRVREFCVQCPAATVPYSSTVRVQRLAFGTIAPQTASQQCSRHMLLCCWVIESS